MPLIFSSAGHDGHGNLSMAERVALVSDPDKRIEILAELSEQDPDLEHSPAFWLRPNDQLAAINSLLPVVLMMSGRGGGKQLSLDTMIPTPEGWTRMGDLRVGDRVFDEAGRPCHVEAVYDDPAPESCWRLTFSDKTEIIASGEHQWVTWTHRDRKQYQRYGSPLDFPDEWPTFVGDTLDPYRNVVGSYGPKVRTTDDIIATHRISSRGDLNHCIPLAGELQLSDRSLPFDPWFTGYYLGNGSVGDAHVTAGSKDGDFDGDFVAAMLSSAGLEFTRRDYYDRGSSGFGIRNIREGLRVAGLLHGRRIPPEYLRSSGSQRLALLRGLMDSDGYASDTKNVVEFSSIHRELAEDVVELSRSLGEKPVLAEGRAQLDGRDMGPKFRVTWRPRLHNPFALPRKADRIDMGHFAQRFRACHRMITDVTPHPIIPMRCITVDSPNSMYLCGEGMIPTHNTRTGSNKTIQKAKEMPGSRIHLVGRTVADVRDTMIQGESGILALSPPDFMPVYVPSLRKMIWPNSSVAITFSSETPDQLRGPQSHFTWADELAAFKLTRTDVNIWDQIQISTRLGEHPQIFVTTTPKRIPLIKELVERAERPNSDLLIVTGSTYDNRANLSSEYLQTLIDLYAGTALEEQELYGRLVLVVEGSLWKDRDFIIAPLPEIWNTSDKFAVTDDPQKQLEFVTVIAVDPSASSGGDETGIVRIQSTRNRHEHISQRRAWVTADRSLQGSPEQWAKTVADLYHETNEDHLTVVVAEKNQGGEMVRTVIQSADPAIPVALIPSVRSKAARAEPVVLAYRRGRVFHVENFPELEAQLTEWEPDSKWSPDRLDALVHGLTTLLIDDRPIRPYGRVTIGSANLQQLDGVNSRARREIGTANLGSWRGGGRSVISSSPEHYGR